MVANLKENVAQDIQFTNSGNKFTPTVFQAEILGIKIACEQLLQDFDTYKPRYVKIFSDSQAAKLALDSLQLTLLLVKDCLLYTSPSPRDS